MTTIVFLNEEDQSITIVYGKNVQILNWSDLDEIAEYLLGKDVYYVTGAEIVTGESVIELLGNVTGVEYIPKPKSNLKYLYSVSPTKLVCRGKKGDLIFNGPSDMKPMKDLDSDIFETNISLKKCLEIGKIKIVNEDTKNQIMKKYQQQKQKSKNAKDASIDKILIKGSVDEFFKNQDSDENNKDIIEIDVDSSHSFKKEDDQEIYSNMKRLGINTD